MPLFLRGVDAGGQEFLDLTKTLDISSTGAYLASPRPLRHRDLVSLTIPAPSISTGGLLPPGNTPIQARVLRMQKVGDIHLIGVEFLKGLE